MGPFTDLEPEARRPRSKKTIASYTKRARQLLKCCVAEIAQPQHRKSVDWATFVTWLIAQRPNVVASTWRQYKSASSFLLERAIDLRIAALATPGDPDEMRKHASRLDTMNAELRRLQAAGSQGCADITRKTSSQKAKRFSEKDRHAIIVAAERSGSRYAGDLADYLVAAKRSGLRPVEWADTILVTGGDPDVLVLSVLNAKADDLRAHGKTRTLNFTHLPSHERLAVERWVGRMTDAGTDGPRLIKALGDLLYAITRALWPRRSRRITLYSARHEFAALAKLRYAPEEVAALMGHATDVTATDHYGRYRARALPPDLQTLLDRLPMPDPIEISRVRRKLSVKLDRLGGLRRTQTAQPTFP